MAETGRGEVNGPEEDQSFNGRLILITVFGFVLLVPPLLSVFNTGAQVFGVPVIWAYLFVVWAVLIGLAAALAGRSG
ncbi:hypothetical protein [Amycolatopsis xylanica]|uniref:hypothetical protein n=1 Tax=Amycolatopsis xylanica TaxID=589385 RepID=UPI001C408FDE|nr:hypothetical protein [Amycolatopsis xylanica]